MAADTHLEVRRLIHNLVTFRKGLAKLLLALEGTDYFLVEKASRIMNDRIFHRWTD